MSRDTEDLWGDLPDASSLEIPEDVLFRQAELLTEKTRGTLLGQVRHMETTSRERYGGYGNYNDERNQASYVEFAFDVTVPRMDNYTYQLVSIKYNIATLYPVTAFPAHTGWDHKECADTDEFKAFLRELLGHPDTKRVIAALRAHAEDPRARLRESRRQAAASSDEPPPASHDEDLPF